MDVIRRESRVGTAGLCLSLRSLPPPKIFWKMFFFFSGAGWVELGAAPAGGGVGAAGCWFEGSSCCGVFGVGCASLWPPIPKSFWKKFWGDSDIWLQVFCGAVPSRKAT